MADAATMARGASTLAVKQPAITQKAELGNPAHTSPKLCV